MLVLESTRMAVGRLLSSRTRSFLTMLGVIIGTAAVVALVAVGRGANSSVSSSIQGLGTNLLTINAGASTSGGVRGAAGSSTTLTTDDAAAVAELSDVQAVAASSSTSAVVVWDGGLTPANTTTSIVGTTPDYLAVNGYEVQRGSFLNDVAQADHLPVAVLGASVLDDLDVSSSEDVVGKVVKIGGRPFHVIGVLQPKGGSGGTDPDDQVIIPLSAAQRWYTGSDSVRSIAVQVQDGTDQTLAVNQVSAVMRQQHGIADATDDDFTVTSQSQLLSAASDVSSTLTYLLAGVAAISLVVGGIGIMNMMLVTVQQRTYEIGLRKALGARRADVLLQFLSESVLLSVLGGALGVGVGLVAAWAIGQWSGWATSVSTLSVYVAFGTSVVIGVVFGVFPAMGAARLDPVTALRER